MDTTSMRHEVRGDWAREARRLCAMLSRAPEDAMSAASLVIYLDDRERQEQRLLGLSRRLAEEYGLASSVSRDGDMYSVRFCRREQVADELGLLRRRLERELRPLGRGLAHCTWSDTLEAVSTDVRLPGDATHEHLLRAACRQVAEEFALGYTVRRSGEAWIVRFTRPVPAGETPGVPEQRAESAAGRALRAALARAGWAARRLYGTSSDA
jgi:hypothetical protein